MSDDQDSQQPIIIKKITVSHGGHHGGSWKVAFADFMTAMMAFFLVLWLVGQESKIKESVAGYFTDPVGFARGGKVGSGKGTGFMHGSPGLIQRSEAVSIVRKSLENAAKKILASLSLSKDFQKLKDNVIVEMTSEGLRIQLVEDADSSFFEPGSARMRPTGQAILGLIAEEVGKLPNRIVYEGHTDASGHSGLDGYTNWDLGADRANYARKIMTKYGARKTQTREVRSYADTSPFMPNDPYNPKNRRISILVLNDYDYLFRNKMMDFNGLEVAPDSSSNPDTSSYGILMPDSQQAKSQAQNLMDAQIKSELEEIDEETFEVPDYLKDDSQ